MSGVLERFFDENRRLLTGLLAVLAGNVAFWLLLAGPAQLRARVLAGDLESAHEDGRKANRELGLALLEARLLESAEKRVQSLHQEVFQNRRDRFGRVDLKVKQLAGKFRLDPHSMTYGYSDHVPERLEEMSFPLNLKGSYDNLRRFVTEIELAKDEEGRDLFFSIDRVALADSTETGSELNLMINVATYFSKPELKERERLERGRAQD